MHPFRQAADIMMRLDGLGRPFKRNRFDDIRIKRALHKIVDGSDTQSFFLKNSNELVSDKLPFLLGIAHTGHNV